MGRPPLSASEREAKRVARNSAERAKRATEKALNRRTYKENGSPKTTAGRTHTGGSLSGGRGNVPTKQRSTEPVDSRRVEDVNDVSGDLEGRDGAISGELDVLADHDRGEREARSPALNGNQGAANRSQEHPTIAARLAKRINEFGSSALDRVAHLGTADDEDDEEEDEDERESALEHIRDVYVDWREQNGGKFTAEEAEERRESLLRKLSGWSDDVDGFLKLSNAQQEESRIWHLDEDEVAPLVNILLKRAMRDENTAVVVRAAMDGDDYIRAAFILGPRLFATARWYPAHGGFRMDAWKGQGPQ